MAEDRTNLTSAIREEVAVGGNVRELVSRTVEEAKGALRRRFSENMTGETKVSLTQKAFRGSSKAYVNVSEELAARLILIEHLTLGWVTCRLKKKVKAVRYYRCLWYVHLTATCDGLDIIKDWRCGKFGHRSATFRKAAPKRKPREVAR